ncbi:MAG: ABC transporter permease [Saprospiraceae bacterium]|nr:ABC transporter permease [Saprospiraceae bacterium]
MLRNFMLVAWRHLVRQPLYSILNVLGLAVGIAACLFILLYLDFELNYDEFHQHKDRLYRVETSGLKLRSREMDVDWFQVPRNLGPLAREEFPEIEEVVCFHQFHSEGTINFDHEGRVIGEEAVYAVDSNLFSALGFELVAGSPSNALHGPNRIIISQNLARRIFGDSPALGKVLTTEMTHARFHSTTNYTFEITGVFEDLPPNSHMEVEALLSASTDPMLGDYHFSHFTTSSYFLLHPQTKPQELAAKLTSLYERHLDPDREPVLLSARHELRPITAIHMEATGGPTYLYIFGGVALLLLLIAMISYVNMVTAQASRRSLEVGLRKVLGSSRQHLMGQFLTESVVLSGLGLALAIVTVWIGIEPLNELLNLQLYAGQLLRPQVIVGSLSIWFLLGVLGGSYPAFFLSAFQPITVMKGQKSRGVPIRRALVAVQFTVVLFVLICTGMIYQQLQFMRAKDLGFEKDQMLQLGLEGADAAEKYSILREQLLQYPGIKAVSLSSFMPGMSQMARRPISAEGTAGPEPQFVHFGQIDDDFLETMDIQLVAGRNYSPEFPADDTTAVIVNEAFCRNFGIENPIGARIRMGDSGNPNYETIVGVVEDFHQSSLHDPIASQLFFRSPGLQVGVKVTGNWPEAIAHIQRKWTDLYPETPFAYEFLNEGLDRLYETDQIRGRIFISLSLMTLFIAFLGLFGLASYVVSQRDKELAVRKIVGAKWTDLVALLTRDFLWLVILAAIPAFIGAWFLIKNWLEDFAYQAPINYGLFLAVLAFTLLFVLLTTGLHAMRAARLSPAEALKSE